MPGRSLMADRKGYATSTKERVEDELEEHRQEKYGGLKIGAAFYGWLVATGLSALLISIASAAGAALALTQNGAAEGAAGDVSEEVIGLLGGVLLLAITALSYFAGGYVAGRLARFDGARQGVGTWLIGVLAVLLAGLSGAIFGARYNVFQEINLPHIPIEAGELTAAGLVTSLLVLGVTLLAAIFGGKVGARYHKKVDRTGIRPE